MPVADASVRTPDVHALREHFPSLKSGFAYLENAGGSQVPGGVAEAIARYMTTTYVQLDAGYPQSDAATENVAQAHRFANTFMGGDGVGQTILGPSTTALLHILANAYAMAMESGARIIAAETGHEANIGPWAALANRGFEIKIWRVNPSSFQCNLQDLERMLKERPTKIVALPHVSNLLGEIVDLHPIVELAHRYGARVVVDGVAYAPHRPIDVKAWGVDWYAFSWYKVYGPHMAALYGSTEALTEIEGPNHFFINRDTPYKFELGGANHEGCAGLNALPDYLGVVAGVPVQGEIKRDTVVEAMNAMAELEAPLQRRYVDFLKGKKGVRIVGPAHAESSRVTTISFVHEHLTPPEIVQHVNSKNMGIRYGNAYAFRLCKALGIDPATGVVRASFVHYNTLEEVERLCAALDEVF